MASPISPPSFILFIFASTAIFNHFLVYADSNLLLGHKLIAGGGRRSLMSFKEKATGSNITYECSPSGPCVYCLYSEKSDEKYRCSETGYRIPLKCVEIGTAVDKGKSKKTNKKGRSAVEYTNDKVRQKMRSNETKEQTTLIEHRNLLEESSRTSGESEPYITYRSCIPAIDEEKLSVLGFESLRNRPGSALRHKLLHDSKAHLPAALNVIMLGLLLVSGSAIFFKKRQASVMQGAVRVPTSSRF